MNTASTLMVRGDPAAVLDRHAVRRAAGVPTVTMLVGPVGAGARAWRHWTARTARGVVVTHRNRFPRSEWLCAVAERTDIPTAAIHCLARRANRDPDELLAAWQAKTPADRERFWNALVPNDDDGLLRIIVGLAGERASASTVAARLNDAGDRIVPLIARLVPSDRLPSILLLARSADEFFALGSAAGSWAIRVPELSIALSVPPSIWDQYLGKAAESRVKAILREGELPVPVMNSETVERALIEAGVNRSAIAAVAAADADVTLLALAAAAARASAAPPADGKEDDHARSAAERFLFAFLESLPETTGRFELNGTLDFGFGPGPAEVDFLCRAPRIAIELDGYFHFLDPDAYRRDRAKDWELQRRGFLVLRFLAEDVIPQLEVIRDRILEALTVTPVGADS